MEIKYLIDPNLGKIPYFIGQNDATFWVSGSRMAELLGYKNPRATLSDHVSAENKKSFKDLSNIKSKEIRPNTLFINSKGINEIVGIKKLEYSDSITSDKDFEAFYAFFRSTKILPENKTTNHQDLGTIQANNITFDFQRTDEWKKDSFPTLASIPETYSKKLESKGFVYLASWNHQGKAYGKIGKTRELKKRNQTLSSEFKGLRIRWFCECLQMDILETQILEKLKLIGALIENEFSRELFDPSIISFEEVQTEIQRLKEVIDRDYQNSSDVERVELAKLALNIIEKVTNDQEKQYALEMVKLLQPLFQPIFTGLDQKDSTRY